MKILHVDDETDFLKQAKTFLEKEEDRLDIETTTSAEEGLELLEGGDYDAIVSGYQMPEMDGLEFLETVREDRGNDIPFIMFTRKGCEEVAIEALSLGADRYLWKEGSPKIQFSLLLDAIVDEVNHREVLLERERLEAGFSSLVEGLEDPIYIVDEDCRYVFANEEELDRHGMRWEEMIGRNFHDLHPEGDSQEFKEKVEKVLKTGEPERQETRYEGGERYLVRSLSPVENPETGEVDRVSVISKDITERKEKEKMQREKERYEELFKGANEFILTTDSEGYIKRVSRRALDDLGYSKDELVGKSSLKIAHPEDEKEWIRIWKEILEEGEATRTFRAMDKDGNVIWFKVGGRAITRNGEIVEIQYTGQNITDRVEAEEQARLEKKRFEELFEGANEGIITTDEEGYIKRVNKRGEEIGGYSEEEAIGNSILMFAPPDERDKYIEFWERILDGEEPVYEVKVSTKDGKTRHVRTAGRPVREDGEIVEIQYNYQDITKRVESEKREKFLHSLLRHDVKNKALVVKGYLDLLREANLSEEYEGYLERAIKATESSTDLIEKVKTLREIEEVETKEIDLEPLIRDIVKSFESTTSEMDFQIEMECPSEGCKVEAGPLLKELFSNLLENSVRHSGGNKIRISNREKDGEMVCFLEDDGKGIPDEKKEKIFERGYKKGDNAGSGLGMYLVKKIAESYGGGVEIEDSELGGARFDVHLPKA